MGRIRHGELRRRAGTERRTRARAAGIFAAAMASALVLAACGSSGNGSGGNSSGGKLSGTVNVGVLGAFSGTIPYGQFWMKGAQDAASYIDANGGIMGKKVHLIAEDDGLDPVDAVTVGRKMLATDSPNLVLGLAVIDWRDVMPILESAHMVSITQIADPYLDKHLLPYSFAATPSDALEGTAMVEYCKQKGYKKIAVVFDEESNAQTLVPAILAAAKKVGLDVVANPTLPVGVPSYEAEVQKVMAAKPDVILTQVAPTTAGTFFPELYNAGGKNIPLVGSDSTLQASFVKAASSLGLEKHLVALQAYSSVSGQGGAAFVAGYQKQFHTSNYDVRSTYAYDGLTVAALAMIDAHSTDPSVYVKYIPKVTTPGPGVTNVYTFKQGEQDLAKGMKIKYVGVGSDMTFNKFHRVAAAFEVDQLVNGKANRLTVITAASLSKLNS